MLQAILLILCLIPSGVLASNIDIDISINTPPPMVFASPPEMTVIPGNYDYVYIIPEVSGLYFHSGYWYRHYRGNWFRATFYEGPWVVVYPSMVPTFVLTMPTLYPQYQTVSLVRISYCDFERNWKDWGYTRHWHKYDWYRRGWQAQANHQEYRYYRPNRQENRVYYREMPPTQRFDRNNNRQTNGRVIILPPPVNNSTYEVERPRDIQRSNNHNQGHAEGQQRWNHKNSPL